MKPKKKKSRSKNAFTHSTLNALLTVLESCNDALVHNNFNLAEVWISEYVEEIPQPLVDQTITKSIYHSLQKRDGVLLHAAVEAEIERLRTEKVKLLRERIIR